MRRAGLGKWLFALVLAALALPLALTAQAQDARAPRTFVLLVSGLGGEAFFSEQFQRWSLGMLDVLEQRMGIPGEDITYLAENMHDEAIIERVDGTSKLAYLLSALSGIAQDAQADDQLLVTLVGHGTANASGARFNLPGPDLSAAELDAALDDLGERGVKVAVVNATASSAPFMKALSAPGRIIITATSTQAEMHFTRFGGHFVDALAEPGADADKDGRISLLEAFRQAQLRLAKSYEDDELLRTEHAQLEDTGDGVASREPGKEDSEGQLASRFYLAALPSSASADAEVRVKLVGIEAEARRLVDEIEVLKRDKPLLSAEDYRASLEALLVQLALNRRELRALVALEADR